MSHPALRLETQRETLVVYCLFTLMGLSLCLGIISILKPSHQDKASYHYKQAAFYQQKHESLAAAAPQDLLYLSEKQALQALSHDPYDAESWSLLAGVTQENQRMSASYKALSFSHKLSSIKTYNGMSAYKVAIYKP